MFDPTWDEGCPSCTAGADEISPGLLRHLHARDTTLAVVSRAPMAKIERYKASKGWDFPWYSSHGSDFNYDFHVTLDENVAPVEYNYLSKAEMLAREVPNQTEGEAHGLSVFFRVEDDVFHTYSSYARGNEEVIGAFIYLDITPKGRNEKEIMDWVRRHDEYEDTDGGRGRDAA